MTTHQSHTPVPDAAIDRLLREADKPGRYIGGEAGSIVKKDPVSCRIALCFPDVYEVAESHLGSKILYHVVNEQEDLAAERVYALWPELERRAQQQNVPLWSLESRLPLSAFDAVGFTLQYELSYPTILAMLEHGGVQVWAEKRRGLDPFVLGGGAGAFNPEPVAPFFDAMLLGDGEEALPEMLRAIARGRARDAERSEILQDLARIHGVYVPSHYRVEYGARTAVTVLESGPECPHPELRSRHGTPRVPRRTLADLDAAAYPTAPIVPNLKPVHDRVAVEIQRGCCRGCRFCQAGMTARPTRQRRPDTVLRLAEESIQATGARTVGLLSLSAGDYGPINDTLCAFFRRFGAARTAVSLPSLRTETLSPEMAQNVATVRKSGFTLAPEAGTERLRRVINKTNTEADLLQAVASAAAAGWRLVKLYFMIGLPTETDDDVDAIAELAERSLAAARRVRRDANVAVSVSTFVPKSHTPLQWERQISIEQTRAKHRRLRDRLRRARIDFRYHSPEQSFCEGVLARGDRRLAPALLALARAGCRLDAWTERYQHDLWALELSSALAPYDLEPADYLAERQEHALLPWDHLDGGVLRKFLVRERQRAHQGAATADCALEGRCRGCGACDLGSPYLQRDERTRARAIQLKPVVQPRDAGPTVPPSRPACGAARSGPQVARSRVRFRYAKRGRALHLSHLDTMDHIIRAIRQVDLPVLYSEGHNPRPKISFSPACPTGIASEAELFDARCAGFPNPADYARKLSDHLPAGLQVLAGEEIPWHGPSINEQLVSMTYLIRPPEDLSSERIHRCVRRFLDSPVFPAQVMRKRKVRILDARAAVADLCVEDDGLRTTVAFRERATLKIRELVALILGPESVDETRLTKVAVQLGTRSDPEDHPAFLQSAQSAFDLTGMAVHDSDH